MASLVMLECTALGVKFGEAELKPRHPDEDPSMEFWTLSQLFEYALAWSAFFDSIFESRAIAGTLCN